jgi:hypothetical protein
MLNVLFVITCVDAIDVDILTNFQQKTSTGKYASRMINELLNIVWNLKLKLGQSRNERDIEFGLNEI